MNLPAWFTVNQNDRSILIATDLRHEHNVEPDAPKPGLVRVLPDSDAGSSRPCSFGGVDDRSTNRGLINSRILSFRTDQHNRLLGHCNPWIPWFGNVDPGATQGWYGPCVLDLRHFVESSVADGLFAAVPQLAVAEFECVIGTIGRFFAW